MDVVHLQLPLLSKVKGRVEQQVSSLLAVLQKLLPALAVFWVFKGGGKIDCGDTRVGHLGGIPGAGPEK